MAVPFPKIACFCSILWKEKNKTSSKHNWFSLVSIVSKEVILSTIKRLFPGFILVLSRPRMQKNWEASGDMNVHVYGKNKERIVIGFYQTATGSSNQKFRWISNRGGIPIVCHFASPLVIKIVSLIVGTNVIKLKCKQ